MPLFRRGGEDDRDVREAAAAEQAASLEALERGGLPLRAQQRLAELGAGGGLFTSDLSVNEFALGREIGLRPLAQVMGSSIYHVGWQQNPGVWGGWQAAGVSQELTTLSEAWNSARQRAFSRLEQEARLLGAHAVVGRQLTTGRHDGAGGMVGVSLAHSVEEREASSGGSSRTDLVVTVHVLGTSIAIETESVSSFSPLLTVDLSADSHPAHVLGGNR